ncbi:MAG: ATP-binding protein [Simkaniaceae bacterium]|nr:ATP-binding protein [Candidatus Sacchlamyda saccharinae]
MIIGRNRQRRTLKTLVNSAKSEFLAIYGRRRIGKTFLIKNFVDSLDCVFFHVTGIQKGTLKEQLEEFAMQIGKTFYKGPSIIPKNSWKAAFEDLTLAIQSVPKEKKVVLFLDEFPWMATPRSKILQALELYWNRYWVFDGRIKLIICGSATSWIIENIINNKGGLHNRVTRTIHLKPFQLHEVESYLNAQHIHLTKRQILDLYIVLGGVPLYWTYIQKGNSASQSIDELCFQGDGPLINEFSRLFDSLFEDSKIYIDIVRIIAKHRYGIGQAELISQAKLPDGGNTTRKLKQLEEVGFITSLVPFGHKERGVYYLLDDEYCLFYLNWIEPNFRSIAKKAINKNFWMSQSKTPSWRSWSGYAFESICYKHIDQIRVALNIDPGAVAGTWRYAPRASTNQKGAQIDLLFDRPDGTISICEIKYSESPFTIDKSYAQELYNKIDVFRKQTRTQKQFFLSMITAFGVKENMYSEEMVTNQIHLDDIFREV